MHLPIWDCWPIKAGIALIFSAAALLDFLNQDQIRSWNKSYWPMYFAALAVGIFEFFQLFGLQIFALTILFSSVWLLAINWNRLGLNIFALGIILNYFAASLNDGKMPVFDSDHEKSIMHQTLTEKSFLPFLSDWIHFGDYWLSIGDVLLFVGATVFLLHQAYLLLKKRIKTKKDPIR